MNCAGCVQITRGALIALGQSVSNLQHLKCLSTNFKACPKIENLSFFDVTLDSISQLSALSLDLSACAHLVDTAGLIKLSVQVELRRLVLDLNSCDRLVQLTDVFQSLTSLSKLEELSVRLGGCAQFNDADSMFRCVGELKLLTQLQLNMSGNYHIVLPPLLCCCLLRLCLLCCCLRLCLLCCCCLCTSCVEVYLVLPVRSICVA